MTSIESVTLEVPDPTAATAFYAAAFGLGTRCTSGPRRRRPTGFRGFTLRSSCRSRPPSAACIDSAVEAGATTLKPSRSPVGLRRRRPGPRWRDLEGRDVGEEGHRPGDTAGRPDRAPAGGRRRGCEQAVLRRPRPDRGKELRPQVRRVRYARRARSSSGSTGDACWPRTPASPPRAPARTGSRSAATPACSPTRTGSRGRPHQCEPPCGRRRLSDGDLDGDLHGDLATPAA